MKLLIQYMKRESKAKMVQEMSTASKLDFIDALRGYAIPGAFIVHTSQKGTKPPSWLGKISAEGAKGVLFLCGKCFYLILFVEIWTRE